MPTPTDLLDLTGHLEWADALVWSAVQQADAARTDARVRGWLHHVHLVQHSFLCIWRDERPVWRDLSEFPDAKTLSSWGRDAHRGIRAFVEALDAERIGREVRIPWAEDVPQLRERVKAQPTLGETVMQVAMHSAHHRAQVCARLREIGGEPPLVDFIGWIWFGRPAADWTALEQSL
jgi:uncharacterized damage-inducible protein DinB